MSLLCTVIQLWMSFCSRARGWAVYEMNCNQDKMFNNQTEQSILLYILCMNENSGQSCFLLHRSFLQKEKAAESCWCWCVFSTQDQIQATLKKRTGFLLHIISGPGHRNVLEMLPFQKAFQQKWQIPTKVFLHISLDVLGNMASHEHWIFLVWATGCVGRSLQMGKTKVGQDCRFSCERDIL